MRALLFKLTEAGVHAADTPEGLRVRGRAQHPMEIRTMAYPGFPTDLQAPMMVLCCQTPGTSVFLETIFENRYMHAAELARMGARIRVEDRVAIVEGVKALTGAQVRATDPARPAHRFYWPGFARRGRRLWRTTEATSTAAMNASKKSCVR